MFKTCFSSCWVGGRSLCPTFVQHLSNHVNAIHHNIYIYIFIIKHRNHLVKHVYHVCSCCQSFARVSDLPLTNSSSSSLATNGRRTFSCFPMDAKLRQVGRQLTDPTAHLQDSAVGEEGPEVQKTLHSIESTIHHKPRKRWTRWRASQMKTQGHDGARSSTCTLLKEGWWSHKQVLPETVILYVKFHSSQFSYRKTDPAKEHHLLSCFYKSRRINAFQYSLVRFSSLSHPMAPWSQRTDPHGAMVSHWGVIVGQVRAQPPPHGPQNRGYLLILLF